MPVDIAMRICMSPSAPIHNFFSSYKEFHGVSVSKLKPLRSCLNQKVASSEIPTEEWEDAKNNMKKKVVFADMKGLSLTAVHIFSDMEDALPGLHFKFPSLGDTKFTFRNSSLEGSRLALDFTPPSANYLSLRNKLHKNSVCLENCIIRENCIAGTVKVRNVAFEKKVQVRITFNSWQTFMDVDCSYMHNTYNSTESDTFSFEIDLPKTLKPWERIEFCVSFRCGENCYWDNNDGENYRVVCERWQQSRASISGTELPNCKWRERIPQQELDQFGGSGSGGVVVSHWQNWGRMERLRPYW
ncbi:protein phosphatase 1 regulatory subunit 3C-like [Latimeria chalumnae]|nr:PREDICTED: protein phosphatase 1 regulatory subunit 3C-like [Latimeria chalumnae]XP_006002894.1 PREDICTED: protein phosphatase 1 regulatory subunit 3C-like [Latimeria chalumnae]|eukprot:XP_006002893.1 PREDICTED: protein phosphatase 1 regulatory subunit 3C-like [Latimeria chalumnae]